MSLCRCDAVVAETVAVPPPPSLAFVCNAVAVFNVTSPILLHKTKTTPFANVAQHTAYCDLMMLSCVVLTGGFLHCF
jgi:hypothetical protein